jgi:signal transduction histidine kinase
MAQELAVRDEALRTMDRLRRQMLADVSHELKTPLTAMLGYVETLHMADVALDDATRDRYFETLERETRRLDRIVRDLLDLARLENGIGPLDARVFTIARVFEHVIQRHEQESRRQGIAVRVAIDDKADQVTADPDRIEQAVENLFANALRHISPGGVIELAARAEGESIVLSVVDSGAGIAASTCRMCSTASTRPTPRERATPAAAGWASRSRKRSFSAMADRFTSTASPAEPRLPSFCPTSDRAGG